MNALVTSDVIERDAVVFRNEMNELVERLALCIKGNDVQILRFDGNNERVLVKVNDNMSILPLHRVDGFIRGRI